MRNCLLVLLLCSSAFAQVDKKYVSLAVASKWVTDWHSEMSMVGFSWRRGECWPGQGSDGCDRCAAVISADAAIAKAEGVSRG